MTNRRNVLGLVAALVLMPGLSLAEDRIPVVASFSILGDLVTQVGGDRVAVTVLVGPDGDAHVFQPTPADAQAVAAATVLFVNGLGFEGWMDRLVESAEYKGTVVVATMGVTLREMTADEGHDLADNEAAEEAEHDHDATDPHAWQSVANVRTYVANIEAGLAAADPAGAETYRANAAAYTAQLDALDVEIKAMVAALPADRRTIVTSHDAFGYFAAAYGMTFVAPRGMSTETEASAADVAGLITQIRDQKIPAVFVENISDPRLLKQITAETAAVIGGTLFSDALSPTDGPAGTYISMMRHNITTLAAALRV